MRIWKSVGALLVTLCFVFGAGSVAAKSRGGGGGGSAFDLDPNLDLALKVTILEIWEVDKVDSDTGTPPGVHNPADFYWTVSIESVFRTDPKYSGSATSSQTAWPNQDHIKPMWSFTQDIDDWNARAWINITLYDDDGSGDDVCDISPDPGRGTLTNPEGGNAEIYYGVDYGRPMMDDADRDSNGVWHLSGTQDGSYTTDEDDCDLWYSVTQVDKNTGTDKDGDGIPWYLEAKVYGTNPNTNNLGQDLNGDGLPIEWECKYGLSVIRYPNNLLGDADNDGLTLQEEYRWRSYGCAPDYPDVLVEIDYLQGHTPAQVMIDDATAYYLSRPAPFGFCGIRLTIVVDQALPSSVVDPNGDGWTSDWGIAGATSSEADAIRENPTYFADAKEGAWRYCLFIDHGWQYDYYGRPELSQTEMGWTYVDETPGDWFVVCYGGCEGARLLSLVTLEPISKWVEWAFVHELGHTLSIIKTRGGTELYCQDDPDPGFGHSDCAMSNTLDAMAVFDVRYCEAHWALANIPGGIPFNQ
jgi:hypothetical protein